MPRGRGIYDDEDTDEPGDGPGASRQGREGEMATRESTPDVAETDQEPTA